MSKKKRIAWISPSAVISTDRFVVPELSKEYDVDWFIIAWKDESVDFEKELESLREKKQIRYFIKRQYIRNVDPRIVLWWMSFLRELKSKKYDLIYQVMLGAPYYMPLFYHYMKHQKILIAIHNVIVPKGGTHYKLNKWYGHYTIHHFDYFHTFSKSQMEELLRVDSSKKCDYSPFAIMDYGTSKKNDDVHEITFLNFGLIRDYKRVDVLIAAAQQVRENTDYRFRVIIAGNCDNWDKYERMIKYPEIFDLRIRRIEDDEVPELFSEADYFVAPYQDIAQSGSIVIAINYDVPTIASRLPAFGEYIIDGETGFLVNPADKNDLARVMCDILSNGRDSITKQKLAVKEWKTAHLTAEKVAQYYIRNFNDVMNNK